MKVRRRIFIAVISLLTVCLALFGAACKDRGDGFYRVTFVYDNGQEDTVVSVEDGKSLTEPRDPERGGYEFLGWFLEGEDEAYDFSSPVKKDFSLYAHWQQGTVTGNIRLTWIDRGEAYDFVFKGGRAPSEAQVGDVVTFSVNISPYYIGTPAVTARVGGEDRTLAASEGMYSFTVPAAEGTISFSVTGLELDRTPIRGTGTSANPYIIETPAQFRRFGLSVNSESDGRYNGACVRLGADLDFKGESLDPIGTNLSTTYFSGEFDGNGKTISNLVPGTDIELVVGIFGYAVQASIRNLNVVGGYDLCLDRQQNYCVGGIVAYNIGSDIIGCTFKGDVTVDMAAAGGLVYAGGIVGFAQGYSTDYSAAIAYCSASGSIQSVGRNPLYAAGGIAGATVGTAESAPVLVTNCTFSGDVGGFGGILAAGGAVGYLREYSGVSNLYTEGTVSASYPGESPSAGGLVGFAENETAVVSSYSASVHSAQGNGPDSNSEEGDVVGAFYKDGTELSGLPLVSVDGRKVLVLDAYEVKEGKVGTANADDFEAIKALLGWTDADWTFENGKPHVKPEGEENISVNVTFSFVGHQVAFDTETGEEPMSEREVTVTDAYLPVNWIFRGSGMNTFVAEDGYISYGYFLDEELTLRVPSAMPVTRGMTIYVGFADYGEVAGEYYAVITGDRRHEVKLTFNDMGMMTMYSEGRLAYEMYVWDGEKVLIRDAYFANFAYSVQNGSNTDLDTDFYAEFNGDRTLTIYDNYFFIEENGEGTKPIPTYPKNNAMGEWYTANETYAFYADGTGTRTGTGGSASFTYTCADNSVTIDFGGSSSPITADISADGKTMKTSDEVTLSVTRLDGFAGIWEAEYGYNKQITFDGRGSFTYGEVTGTYRTEGDTATLEGRDITASFNADGLLVLTEGGKETVMGREGSYIGTWTDEALGYTLVLTGIGRDGYGFAYDSRGFELTYLAAHDPEMTDSTDYSDLSLTFWYRTSMYGMGNEGYSSGEHGPGSMLYLAMYTPASGYMVDDYNMAYVDQFAGAWNAADGTSLEFNGYGGYDINMFDGQSGTDWIVEGHVTHTAADGTESDVRYTFTRETGKAEFTVGTVNYTAVFNGETISVSTAGGAPVEYREPDLFGGMSFQSAEGDEISFNGKSNVGLGKASVTAGGVKTEYDYTFEGETAVLKKDGETAYTAEIDETNYLVVKKSGEESGTSYGYYSAAFGKEWFGPGGTRVKLNEVFSLEGRATGEFAGTEDAEFELLDPASGTIGVYIYYEAYPSYYIVPIDENALALFDESEELIGVLCLPDGWQGTYTAANGDVLTVDGRSEAFGYGYYAQADITVGNEQQWLVYTVENGQLVLSELDRDGETDRLIARYYVSRTQTAGAVAFTSESGTTVYVTEAQE